MGRTCLVLELILLKMAEWQLFRISAIIYVFGCLDVSRGMCSTEGLLVTGVNSRAVPNCGFILVGKYR